jgi:hypothetical protein
MSMTLTKLSETSTKITLGWTPVPNCIGYVFYADGQRVSNTWDPNRSQVTFAKGPAKFKVQAVGVEDEGVYPSGPPPTGQYPASFFNGPLKERNVVPNDANGGIVILWTGIAGNNEQQQRDLITKRMADAGRKMDGIQFQGDQLTVGGQRAEDWISSQGMLPCMAWNTFTSPATVLSGGSNAAIDAIADRLKKPYRIMMRLMHEFDLGHVPYACTSIAAAPQWVNAWRYIVQRIHARGATNVGFWWCPTEQAGSPSRPVINACYPGDEYVDWVSSDLYNNVGGWSTPLHEGWAEFNELVDYGSLGGPPSMMNMYGGKKPFVVGETGSRFDPANVNRKGNWFRNIDTTKSPSLRGIAFFDVNTGSQEYNNWLVDADQSYANYQAHQMGGTSQNAYQGWKDFVNTARWKGGIRP